MSSCLLCIVVSYIKNELVYVCASFICNLSLLRLCILKRSKLGLLYRIACVCFLYLVLKFLPVCSTYFNGHLLHFI
jgi:hypothetical protein